MAVTLHRCSATWVKIGGHPCWKAQKALDEAGIAYELELHSGLRFRRPEVAEMTGGSSALPIIEFEDGSLLRESSVIAERARNGTLMPDAPPPTAAPPPTDAPPPPAPSDPGGPA
jgi:glutathione S-transferase